MQEARKNSAQECKTITTSINALLRSKEDTTLTPDENSTSLALETPLVLDKISTSSKVTKPIQLRYHETKWKITLLLVTIVAVIVSGARLWHTIASSNPSTYYTAPATEKDNPASIAQANSLVTTNTGIISEANAPLPTPIPSSPTSYEAEAIWNTLANGATILKCKTCSGGEKVGYIGLDYNTNTKGTLKFKNIYKNVSGSYKLTVYYLLSGIDVPVMYISVNGGTAAAFIVSNTTNANVVGTFTITASLNAGANTIKFYNPSACAPDIDRIVV